MRESCTVQFAAATTLHVLLFAFNLMLHLPKSQDDELLAELSFVYESLSVVVMMVR